MSRVNILMCASFLGLSGCMVGPDYHRPEAPKGTQQTYKEAPPGWKFATPRDAQSKGDWWSIFHDAQLDHLEKQCLTANQTIEAQQQAYAQAQALVTEARANLFPTVGASVTATRTGVPHSPTVNQQSLQATASWEIDFWGKIRRQIASAKASAEASEALLANAKLSAGGELATAYYELAETDALQRLLDDTVTNDERALKITRNQYDAGVAAASDVITAKTQLEAAQASAVGVAIARAQYEHAIAVLIGVPPSQLSLAKMAAVPAPPEIPLIMPSELLERRPDVANAERTMAANNELIGVAVAAYYPTISLSGAFGTMGNGIAPLLSASNEAWSIGASAAETIFDAGERGAAVAATRAQYAQSVANYRETVLTALQQVEDALVALRVLHNQAAIEAAAVADASRAAQIALNEYQAGTQNYTAVVTAQNTLLTAQQSQLSIAQSQLTETVALIVALGGAVSGK